MPLVPILFTVRLNHGAGFTDQLTTLALVHEVGNRCGYDFRLTPFVSPRSGEGFTTRYDFAQAFPVLSTEEAALPSVVVQVSGSVVRADGLRTPEALAAMVARQVPAGTALVVFRLVDREILLRDIAWEESAWTQAFGDAMRRVFAARTSWRADRYRVLVHLRCGDTAEIPLIGPLNYRVYMRDVWRERSPFPPPFLASRLVMDAVRAATGPAHAEFRVFSDGYGATARAVAQAAQPGGTLTAGLARTLDDVIRLHEEAARAMVVGDDVRFTMDESVESLSDMIDSAQQAELIVITSAQRLLPKLLATLGAREHPPGLLLLDPNAHDFVRAVRLGEHHARLITLSPHGDPLAPLRAFLAAKANPALVQPVAALAAEARAGAFCIPELASLAPALEARDRNADARMVYEWLAVLTDGSTASLAGVARCAGRAGDAAAAGHAQHLADQAALREAAEARASNARGRQRGVRRGTEPVGQG